MDETIPIPVITTRLMIASSLSFQLCDSTPPSRRARIFRPARISVCRLHGGTCADPQVLRAVDNLAIGGKPAVGNAERQFCAHHALDIDIVYDLADVRQHLTEQLQFADPQSPARPFGPAPDQEKPDHLPERVESETAGHHRIALEMASE